MKEENKTGKVLFIEKVVALEEDIIKKILLEEIKRKYWDILETVEVEVKYLNLHNDWRDYWVTVQFKIWRVDLQYKVSGTISTVSFREKLDRVLKNVCQDIEYRITIEALEAEQFINIAKSMGIF